MFKTGLGIVKEEGLFKLWHGIQSAIFRHAIYSGVRVMLYKKFKDEFSKRNKTDIFPLWQSLTCKKV